MKPTLLAVLQLPNSNPWFGETTSSFKLISKVQETVISILGFLPTAVYVHNILDVNACRFVKHTQFYSCFFVPYEYEYRVTFKENRQSYITLLYYS